MARTSCKMETRQTRTSALRVAPQLRTRATIPLTILGRARQTLLLIPTRSLPKAPLDESFAAVYFTAGGDHAADGRHPVGGIRGVPAASGFRFTASRLPHDTSADVLSGRQPRRDGLLRHCTGGASGRPNPWAEPDALHKFIRQLDHYFAIRFGLKHRHCRTGSAGGD